MMSIRKHLVGVVLAVVAVPSVAAPAPAGRLKLPEIRYERYTLPNGLTVITHEDHRLPLVAVNLWYHVGALDERPGRTGFAHLFEHMMFEGSEHVGEKAHIKLVQAAGASEFNGTTSFDRTNYYETLPANQLELALWLESDRMGFLMEGLDRTRLANQRDVVRNELRQKQGRPYELADEAVFHTLFPQGHPYYGNVIGSHADIEAARIADVRDFHQQFYTPNNASIAIAGDFDPVKLKQWLVQYFGPIPRGPAVVPTAVTMPAITAQRRVTVADTVRLPQLTFAWLTPGAYTPGSDAMDLALYVLGGSKTSRLYRELVEKDGLAQSVRCGVNPLKLAGVAECTIRAKEGVKLDAIEPKVWEEIERLQHEGPTEEEIDAARAFALTNQIAGLEHLGHVADMLNQYNQYTGDPGYLTRDVAALRALTVADVRNAAASLTQAASAVISCVPGKKVLDDVPRGAADADQSVALTNPYSAAFEVAQRWRDRQPAAGPEPSFHLPVPKQFVLSNGLTVNYLPNPALPLLAVRLTVRAGSENNAPEKAGLAAFTANAMVSASEGLDAVHLAEAQERLGTRLFNRASMDSADAGFVATTDHADDAMALLAQVVEHPAFAPEDLTRVRGDMLLDVPGLGDSPQNIALRLGPALLLGDSPYGLPEGGTPMSLHAFTREDAVNFYKTHYGPKDALLTFAGDITEKDAERLARAYFGGWSNPVEPPVAIPAVPAAPTRHIVVVDKPGSSQTALFAFGVGLPISTPDLQAVEEMNYTLGAGFHSRINMKLREQDGYTYGADSKFLFYRAGGLFRAGGLIRTDATAAAAKDLIAQIADISSDPPTAVELKEARDALMQSIPAEFESNYAAAATTSSLYLYGRPLDYFSTLPERYRSVSLADAARVAKEDVHPENLIIVAVGDRAKIEPGLRETQLGPIESRSVGGAVLQQSPVSKP
jgi:zinc protease